MAPEVLVVEGLDAGYGDARILHGVAFHVAAGEVVAILGPNGAGKSTALKAVCGLADVQAGTIRLRGQDIAGRPPDLLTRDGVGYVPQLDNVFPTLSVSENLDMGALGAPPGTDMQAMRDRVAALFPALAGKWKARAGSLSGGQRQMVAMGRALMADPRLLLLDEPSAGLAPNLVASVFEAVQAIADAGVPVLLVEQNAKRALAVADRAYILDNGRNAFEGPAKSLMEDADVARLYLGGLAADVVPTRKRGQEEE